MHFHIRTAQLHYQIFLQSRGAAKLLFTCGLALLLFSAWTTSSAAHAETPAILPRAQAALQTVLPGQAIFDANCTGCHTIGRGKLTGPDLKDVTKRRDAEWLKSFIRNPNKMFSSDPIAQQLLSENNNVRMPFMGLSAADVDTLIAFLADPGPLPYTPSLEALNGDVANGQRLFRGEVELANGGLACIACHSVSGVASLGGGGLGPDLTHVYQRLTPAGLAGALSTISFPTMIGPFQDKPLIPKETADLFTYLKTADTSQPPVEMITPGAFTNNAFWVLGIGAAGGVLFLVIQLVVWIRIKKRYMTNLPVRKL